MSSLIRPDLPLQKNVPVEVTLNFLRTEEGVVHLDISPTNINDVSQIAILLAFTLEKLVQETDTPNDTPTPTS